MSEYKIDSRIAGETVPGFEKVVSARETMNYAAAIGDENPCYFDDTLPQGIIAPPMYTVALTWPMAARLQARFEQFLPPAVLGTVVHATEYLAFFKPIRPGDRLHIEARIKAVKPTRAGTLLISGIEVRNDRQEPVVLEESGSLFRGIACTDQGRGIDSHMAWPTRTAGEETLWEEPVAVPRRAPWVYDGCTGIEFPIHTSVAFARQVGLPDVILQGTAALAMAARAVTAWEAGANPLRLKELACRFSGFIVPGSTVRLQMTCREETGADRKIFFRILNAEGSVALDRGYARIEAARLS